MAEPASVKDLFDAWVEHGTRAIRALTIHNESTRRNAAAEGNLALVEFCGGLIYWLSLMRFVDACQRGVYDEVLFGQALDSSHEVPPAPAPGAVSNLSPSERACDWLIVGECGQVFGSFNDQDRAEEYAANLRTRRGLACSVLPTSARSLRRPDDRPILLSELPRHSGDSIPLE